MHDIHLNDLVSMISHYYMHIERNVTYPKNAPRLVGEIDVIGWNEGIMDIYEVKCNNSMPLLRKAHSQLTRARAYWGFEGDSYLYTPQTKIITLGDL